MPYFFITGGDCMLTEKNNSTCAICGNGYYMCRSCKDQLRLSPWKIHTDTSEHYKIFQIVRGYSIGLYTKDEAKDKFKNVDLADLKDFLPEVQSVIETILADKNESSENENTDGAIDSEKKVRKPRNAAKK